MPRKYSFESEPDEQQPLDNLNYQRSPGSRRLQTQPLQQHHIDDLEEHEPYYDEPPQAPQAPQPPPAPPAHQQQAQAQAQSPRQVRQQSSHYPPSSSRTIRNPAFHPDSAYNQLAADRQYAQAPLRTALVATGAGETADIVSPVSPPVPPPHGRADSHLPFGRDTRQQQVVPAPQPNITPGADNFSESAAGGMAGIAYSVAERNPRESGVEAMRAMQSQNQPQQQMRPQEYQNEPGYPQQAHHTGAYPPQQQYRGYNNSTYDQPEQGQLSPQMLRPAYPGSAGRNVDRDSRSSLQGLGNAAYPPGVGTPGTRTPSRSPHSDIYTDDPYQRYSVHDTQLGFVNPNEIEDDGDDGLEYGRTRNARTSMLSLAGYSTKSSRSGTAGGVVGPAAVGAAAVGAAAAGAVATGIAHSASGELGHGGDMMTAANIGRSGGVGDRIASSGGARYNALNNGTFDYASGGGRGGDGVGGGGGYGSGGGYDSGAYNAGRSGGSPEKSEWLTQQSHSSKLWKWAIIGGIALLAVAGIVLGVVFGVVLKHKSGSSGSSDSSSTASGDTSANGDLSVNSPEIQKLLNNKNLHKVFPGIDYTPINTQYPDCLASPPSQNNVTRDIAVLSQLTNTVRLYGTDCNQTEMTIHAIKQLQMEDTVKIWMGVWQDNNDTTNARQLAQMWDILHTYGADPFKGVIVANEILFREQMTTSQLSTLLSSVRTNMTTMNISLPVATSDLGTVWDAELAEASDYVMANIHPFFGGVNAKDAASWTWNFWETNNGQFFKSDKSKNVISETGWPSQGGTDCGSGSTETSCPDAAVAGITEINSFLSTWVCDALTNGTQYFWFEAFDEPWKIVYDTGDENWEDHWGIMDVDRNLKSGITIPDCDGQTVS
ncbi:hypothetical protein SCUCBS95973_006186 [Sporothrix curviconia]|uniref:glucan endo-1,3-beta-D-glucosidase n=1 Tax=Sporothrix curviconia TaxID=1260050 RepID=A0ABP0C3I4_9PEZI